jgi:hypothetical protein
MREAGFSTSSDGLRLGQVKILGCDCCRENLQLTSDHSGWDANHEIVVAR